MSDVTMGLAQVLMGKVGQQGVVISSKIPPTVELIHLSGRRGYRRSGCGQSSAGRGLRQRRLRLLEAFGRDISGSSKLHDALDGKRGETRDLPAHAHHFNRLAHPSS